MPILSAAIRNDQLLCTCLVANPSHSKEFRIYSALIDTGADSCAISPRVASDLDISPLEDGYITIGFSGPQETKKYRANIGICPPSWLAHLWQKEESNPRHQRRGKTSMHKEWHESSSSDEPKILPNALVAECYVDGEEYDVIIGMDILSDCMLTVCDRRFSLCY